jgi:tetratricopeptide (TPR) repeat protein
MKKLALIFPCLLITVLLSAQSAQMDSLKKHYLKVYNQAVQYNDVNTAISSLHGYIAIDNSIPHKDTLSMLYLTTGSYYSSLMLAQEVYAASPNNMQALARAAECFQNLGDAKKAVEAYEKVCEKVKEPYYFYQLASSQYTLKRLGECEANLQRVIADTNSRRTAVNFTIGDGRVQQVPANAAAYNFLGILKMENNDLASSKKYLQQAVALFPEFIGAQQNLELCEKRLKPAGAKPPANKSTKPAGSKQG